MSLVDTASIWQILPVPAILVDNNNRLTEINPAAEAFMNAAQKSVTGRAFSKCLLVDSDTDLDADLDRARNGQSNLFRHDVNVRQPNSETVMCDIQITPLITRQSEGNGAMMVLVHPRHIKSQLGRALQVKSSAKTAVGLADMLAHEIKNPLAGINGAAQLLEMNLGPQDREMTGLIIQETRRIVDLLKQVEQFGDLRPPMFNVLNIHDILERARLSASLGLASGMEFSDQYDPSLPRITGDADQLIQVFANLFANAAQAAVQTGGKITIRTFYEAGLRLRSDQGGRAVPLQIEIIDDGPGIPPSIVDNVFDPFVSTRENGTGLGLALASKIIAEHNGTIAVNSRPGKTVFRISLPVSTQNKSIKVKR